MMAYPELAVVAHLVTLRPRLGYRPQLSALQHESQSARPTVFTSPGSFIGATEV
jgi:hypothetical protein